MKKNIVWQKMGKISVIMILTSIFIASGFSVYDYFRERSRMMQDFEEIIAPVPGRLAQNLQNPLWFADRLQTQQIIETEMTNKKIYAIVVRESDETLFGAAERNKAWEIVESEGNFSGDFITKKEDIIYADGDETVGTVEIHFSTRFIDEALGKLMRFMVVKVLVMSILLVSIFMLIVNYFFFKPISKVIRSLEIAGTEVAYASSRVAIVGRQLTGGSLKQASAVEETVSSLEEIGTMTRLNTENVSYANTLMLETAQVVNEASVSMTDLTESIGEISKTSEETRKVIRTIEEIAFQINLLALNAAVEAARAGEAGLGFAVVAQEIRNLAMRSRQAAKSTSALIEASIEKTTIGIDMVYKASQSFANVTEGSKKVKELLGEITISSQEQTRGIDQVTEAMSDIDKVTQVNAANAEETSSAIVEIGGQTKRMETVVGELVDLIGERNGKG